MSAAGVGRAGLPGGLPNEAYTSAEWLARELDTVFAPTWAAIGNACTVPEPGDVRPVQLLGVPLVMVRGADGEVRVFHNVCSHRGNQLVGEACRAAGSVTCPYHGWSYGLDGTLVATPHVGGWRTHHDPAVDRSDLGLRPVRSSEWMDLVFVNLTGDAPPFDEHIAPLHARVDVLAPADVLDALVAPVDHGSVSLEFAANWKLVVENNVDAYHLPWVHPGLNSVSRLEDHVAVDGGDLFVGQSTLDYDPSTVTERPLPVFDGWPERYAEYPTLFPNVFFGWHGDHLWTRVIEPVAPDRTLDHFQIRYPAAVAADPDYEPARRQRLEVWCEVFDEDVGIVNGLQRGRRSPGFAGGVFTPVHDGPAERFSVWVAARTG